MRVFVMLPNLPPWGGCFALDGVDDGAPLVSTLCSPWYLQARLHDAAKPTTALGPWFWPTIRPGVRGVGCQAALVEACARLRDAAKDDRRGGRL